MLFAVGFHWLDYVPGKFSYEHDGITQVSSRDVGFLRISGFSLKALARDIPEIRLIPGRNFLGGHMGWALVACSGNDL